MFDKFLCLVVILALVAFGLFAIVFLVRRFCTKSNEPYYVPKTYMEYEMTSVASAGNVGKYERTADLDTSVSSSI